MILENDTFQFDKVIDTNLPALWFDIVFTESKNNEMGIESLFNHIVDSDHYL